MKNDVYRARMAALKDIDLPTSKAHARALRFRQRFKLALWEWNLGSLFFIKRAMDIAGAAVGLVLLSPLFSATILCDDGPTRGLSRANHLLQ